MPLSPVTWLSDFVVNLTTAATQANPRITHLANGNILVVWDSSSDTGPGDPSGIDTIGQLFDPLGQRIGGEFLVNDTFVDNAEGSPDVAALSDGGFLTVYEDSNGTSTSIRLVQRDANGLNPVAVDIANDTTSNAAETFHAPRIAVSSATSALIVYSVDETGGSDSRIAGRIYDSQTNTIGAEIFLLNVAGTNVDPDVAVLTNGNYVIVGASLDNANTTEPVISLRMVSPTGSNVLGFTRLAATNANGEGDYTPSVTALTGGGFVVSWQNVNVDDSDIKAQVFNAAGVAQTGEIDVTSVADTQNNASKPVTVALQDGGFLVLYESDALLGQRYDAAGAKVGSQFFVSSNSGAHDADAVLLADGRVAVSFTGSDGEIHSEIFDTRDAANATGVYGPQDWQIGTIGNDTITSDGDVYFVAGHSGDDVINTGGLSATYYGGTGNDTINVIDSFDADVWNGGAGNDLIDFTNSFADGGVFDLEAGTATANSQAYSHTMTGFEGVVGTAGNDSITANAVSTVVDLTGGAGDDTILGGQNNDSLYGGIGNDALQGAGGSDFLFGGADNDAFEYITGTGYDHIDGGTGTDSMVFGSFFGDNLTIDMQSGTYSAGGPAYGIVDMENVTTSDGMDSVTGNDAGNLITLGQGADTAAGGAGHDTLNGDDGNDSLSGDGGKDTLIGGLGDDTLFGGIGNDSLEGGDGTDVLFGGTGHDDFGIILAAAGFDHLTGGTGADKASFAGTTDDMLVSFDAGSYTVGALSLDFAEMEAVTTGSGNDSIFSATNTTFIDAGAGNDLISLADLSVTVQGGAGHDVLDLLLVGGDQIVDLGTSSQLAGFEDLILGGGDDVGTGSAAANAISGGDGNDTLSGLDDHDSLLGEAGSDSLDGGTGNDSLFGGADADRLIGGAGADSLFGGSEADSLDGGADNDSLVGSSGRDTLGGSTGHDSLFGGGADDSLEGGGGADQLHGGVGNDTIRLTDLSDNLVSGDGDIDLLVMALSVRFDFDMQTGLVTGTGPLPAAAWTEFENYTNTSGLASTETVRGTDGGNVISFNGTTGSHFADGRGGTDRLTGGSAKDTLTGGTGHDSLFGGAGNDTLFGGSGADILAGGTDVDLASYLASAFGVTVNLTSGMGLGGEAQGDVLSSIENVTGSAQNDVLTGNTADNALGGGHGADILTGGIGSDTLGGGDGADTLGGGLGNDTLTGGLGNDIFVFNTAPSATNHDTITDFNVGNDTIRLENTGAGLFNTLPAGALAASAFKVIGPGGSPVDANDRILYRQASGQLYYDADGSGAGAAILIANLVGNPVIDPTDFLVT